MERHSTARQHAGRTSGAFGISLGRVAFDAELHDVWTATGSGIAREALDRIGKL